MKKENHILDILQLYEFSMAIGKSLDYKTNCDLFLKLILKRKNLNAAWIIEKEKNTLNSTYSIPLGKTIRINSENNIDSILDSISDFNVIEFNKEIANITPINISSGHLAIFNLEQQGFLFLFSKTNSLNLKNLLQLQPVLDKFSISLKACKAFKQQQSLLKNIELRNQELSDYAHMVSHDLKSPLRSIDALTAWLKEDYKDAFDNNGTKTLNLIRDNVEKMDTLIKGILEYSTIGKNQMDIYDVDINALINDILNIIQVPDNININKQNLPIIKGDKYRLQQLFQNLIGNAINYNDKDLGIIDIGFEDQDNYWQFYIKDNGKGIEETYFNKIFKTFEKLENNPESTGIGLSIVKKIVDLYGGKIWLESQVNIGTTFYFSLNKEPNGTA